MTVPLPYARPGTEKPPSTSLTVFCIVAASLGVIVGVGLLFLIGSECVSVSETWVPSAAWSPPCAPLTKAEILAVVSNVKAGLPLASPTQFAALQTAIASPTQSLFYPSPDMRWQFHSSSWYKDTGNIEISTARGTLTITPAGVTSVALQGQAYSRTGFRYVWNWSFTGVFGLEVVSLALALFLMFAGISLPRNPPGGERRARLYFRLKIVFAIVTAIAWTIVSPGIGFIAGTIPNIGGLLGAILIGQMLPRKRVE